MRLNLLSLANVSLGWKQNWVRKTSNLAIAFRKTREHPVVIKMSANSGIYDRHKLART